MDLLLIISLSVSTWGLFLILTEIGEQTKRSEFDQNQFDK